ncbi:MAG: hypothetical protein AAGB26_01390 [Planctomycetota bacterium]
MQKSACPTQPDRYESLGVICCVALAMCSLALLFGCQSTTEPEPDIPLPGFAGEGPERPKTVYAVIRRADVPLDESTDDAWSIINEQLVPPLTRGIWRGNGLRIGLLPRNQLDAYSEAMPQPVAFSRILINKSSYPVSILETPRLRSDLRFEIDLTRPPRPRAVETIRGGDNSTLRLLAKIETGVDGRHTLVLTPQHYIPSPLDLIPRDPLEREMDGRVFEELALRVTPGKGQVAVVGLHWPWPIGEVLEEDDADSDAEADQLLLSTSIDEPAADPSDPAAPPRHLTPVEELLERDLPDTAKAPSDASTQPEVNDPKPRYERIASPLATSFGSKLLTGTRIRQPVRTVLLITIEDPPAEPGDAEVSPAD